MPGPNPPQTAPAAMPEPSFGRSHRGLEEGITDYPEVQRNEALTTKAIYPDEFERIHGRKNAWQVRSTPSLRKLTLLISTDSRESGLSGPCGTFGG